MPEARPAASLDIDRELLHVVAELPTPFGKETIVLVDEVVFDEVHVVFGHELSRAAYEIIVGQAGHVPVPDDALRRKHGSAGVNRGGAAIGRSESKRHGAVGSQESTAVLVKRRRHFQFAAGELIVAETGSFLQPGEAHALMAEGRKFLGDGASACARAYDHDVVSKPLHRTASHPRGLAA